jgi:hypothetical protein
VGCVSHGCGGRPIDAVVTDPAPHRGGQDDDDARHHHERERTVERALKVQVLARPDGHGPELAPHAQPAG